MSLQSKEIEILQSQLKYLEVKKAKVEAARTTELEKSQRLLEKLCQVEGDISIRQTLALANETIWMNILDPINEIWPSIQIIFQQKELIKKATKTIVQGREKLGDIPTEALNIIKLLNSKSSYEVEEVGVSDRTATILEVKKVLTKRNLIDQLEERSETLELHVKRLTNKIETLMKKGLPSIYVINDKLITQEDYTLKMKEVAESIIK